MTIRLFVSPVGTDGAVGTADAPVRTPEGARAALRLERARQPQTFADGGAEIIFADGVYHCASPVKLSADDGGTANQPVVWKAAHRGKAILSGGVTISAWRPVTDAKAFGLLDGEARRHVRVADLSGFGELPGFTNGGCGTPERLRVSPISVFCDGKRLPQARWPNDGYVRTGNNVGKTESCHAGCFCRSGVFEFESPRLAKWAQEGDLWMYGLWMFEWADATVRVKGIDVATHQVSVDPEPIGFGIRVGGQFKVLNALSEIDEPGEWVLDRTARRIYCWLPREDAEVTIALSEGIVRANGVTNLRFEDLVFAFARKTEVMLERAKGCTISGSTFRNTSSWGVLILDGSDDRVVGCDLYDLGEGGIELKGGDLNALVPARHVADNNHIHHHGQIVPNYRPGVQLNGVGNRATHNLIHHTLHQAIAFGGNDHLIAYNVCHDCCMFNDDAGTIYCCQRDWRRRGTVIEHNLVHMTGKQPRGSHTEGIYLDDFSSGVIVRNNIINRATLGVYIGGGQDCEVYGNLVFNCSQGICLGSRGIETFAKNISSLGFESGMFKTVRQALEGPNADLWRRRYPKMDSVLGFADGQAAHNAHYNVITNNVLVGCRGLEKRNWKKVASTCVVTNNLLTAEDPGVADYFGMDWSFRPGSEVARRLGDLKFGEMGLYASPLRASSAVRYGEGITRPRAFGKEYDLATVRVDVPFMGKLPEGRTECATDLKNCSVPKWGRGKRVVTGFGTASFDRWHKYEFTFTPTVSGDFQIVTMGTRGEKTLYDNFIVKGATFTDGGFEGGGWTVPKAINTNDYRFVLCNTQRPWGIVTAAEAGVAAAEGAKMWCGSDLINVTQTIRCTAGVPVTITFQARALPIDNGKENSKFSATAVEYYDGCPKFSDIPTPEWASSRIAEAQTEMKAWKGKDDIVAIATISDVHSWDGRFEKPLNWKDHKLHVVLAQRAAKALGCQLFADLGDTGFDCCRTWKVPSDRAWAEVRLKAQDALYRDLDIPFMQLTGNHDRGSVSNRVSNAAFGNRFNRRKQNSAFILSKCGTWGYYDIPGKMTRVIFLNTNENGDGLDAGQIAFLKESLASSGGRRVIVLTHVCLHLEAGKWMRYGNAPARERRGFPETRKVLENFAAANPGRLVCVFAGDSHYNQDATLNGVRYLITQSYGWCGDNDCAPGGYRVNFNRTRDMFVDVICLKPVTGEFRLLRVGARK